MITRRAVPMVIVEHEPSAEQARFEIGAWVTLRGGIEESTHAYRVKGYNRDGSLHLYGGTYGRKHASLKSRAVMPDRLVRRSAPIREAE